MDKKTKDVQKELHKRLEKQLQREENRLCFDCHEKGPRWASMSLGIFICLRCAGIHRALGVHISKVRSTTMDNWEPQWVEFMESMGNERAKQIYEAKWTSAVQRPDGSTADRKLDAHIREKYEMRRWWSDPSLDHAAIEAIARSWAESSPQSPPSASPTSPMSPAHAASPTSAPPTAAPAHVAPKATAMAPVAKRPAAPAAAAAPVAPQPAKKHDDLDLLMDFGEKVKVQEEDDFFVTAPPKAPVAQPPADLFSTPSAGPSLFPETTSSSLFPDNMGDFKSAPNKEDVKNNILNAFSAPAPNRMGAGMAGPPPLSGHMGMMGGATNMGGMAGYPQQGYGMPMGNMGMGNMQMGTMPMGNMPMGNMPMGNMQMGGMQMGNMQMGGMQMGNMGVNGNGMNSMGMGMGMGGGMHMGNMMGGAMGTMPMNGTMGYNNNTPFMGTMQK